MSARHANWSSGVPSDGRERGPPVYGVQPLGNGPVVVTVHGVHTYPHRVAGLVFADTSPAAETAAGRAERRRIADEVTAHGMAAYAERLLPGMLAASTSDPTWPGTCWR